MRRRYWWVPFPYPWYFVERFTTALEKNIRTKPKNSKCIMDRFLKLNLSVAESTIRSRVKRFRPRDLDGEKSDCSDEEYNAMVREMVGETSNSTQDVENVPEENAEERSSPDYAYSADWSSADDTDTESPGGQNVANDDMATFLRQWSLRHKVPHAVLNDLLKANLGHGGKHSCIKCKVQGKDCGNGISYALEKADPHTDAEYRSFACIINNSSLPMVGREARLQYEVRYSMLIWI
ncbi:hypothetical protein AND_003389 [Anopheles darlingi]|uniref:Uncharacterized protein n=1 Tax=Anopheles darlingi TaxID=43151 RepID=W5JKF5_ANODA|nr:hypothetical protein AND_003389 [Anopheles darlingi]